MNVIYTLLVALPVGLLVRDRSTALISYLISGSFVVTFQTANLLMEWVDGDESGLGKHGSGFHTEFGAYMVVNSVVTVVGIGLVLLGNRLRTRRQARKDVVTVN